MTSADNDSHPDNAAPESSVVIVIPARFASTRFPGKPLIALRGKDGAAKPLIQWSYEAGKAVRGGTQVVVATDDQRIAEAVAAFGGLTLMTPPSCANGTERVAACLDQLPEAGLLVNLQGDALLTPPAFVEALIAHMLANPHLQVATAAVRCSAETFRHLAEDAAQGRVGGTTVVLNGRGEALYFSKRILPYLPEGRLPDDDMPVLLHLGLYAYRRAALTQYVAAGATMLEAVEGLEQLRFLYAGVPVAVLVFEELGYPIVEVNNPSDVPIVEQLLIARDQC